MDRTLNLNSLKKSEDSAHEKLVNKEKQTLDDENLFLKLFEYFKNEVDWLCQHLSEWTFRPKITKIKRFRN